MSNLIASLKHSPVKSNSLCKLLKTPPKPTFSMPNSQSITRSGPSEGKPLANWDDFDFFDSPEELASTPSKKSHLEGDLLKKSQLEGDQFKKYMSSSFEFSPPLKDKKVENWVPSPHRSSTREVSIDSSPSWAQFSDESDIIKAHDLYKKKESEKNASEPDNIERDINIIEALETPLQSRQSNTAAPISPFMTSSPITKRSFTLPQKPISFPNKCMKIEPLSVESKRQYSTNNKPDNHTILLQTQAPSEAPVPSDTERVGLDKPAPRVVKPLVLSQEQEYILSLVMDGVSLFYTGSAGTGKSVLLRALIKSLRSKCDKGEVAVTASTGLAACNIGGITLHSFAGVGLGQGTTENLLKKVRRNKKASNRWKEVKVLIIDEISMIDGNFFNMLDEIARKIRRSNKPFGGIQLVICGDFYQLPPVSKNKSVDGTEKEREEAVFAFESRAWLDTIETTLVLKEVFRQRGDQKFIDMLNEMRSGHVSNENNLDFKRLLRPLEVQQGIEPAQLYCTRMEVENANNNRLNRLKGSTQLYTAVDSGSLPPEQRQAVLNNFLTPPKLFLKKGAQVMCIKNFDETLVNGSLGQVIDFIDRDTYMHYQNMVEKPEATAEEIEQTVAEITKREKKERDDEFKFEYKPEGLDDSIFSFLTEETEQVSLGSNSTLDQAYDENINRKRELLEKLHAKSSKNKYPLVKFLLPDKNHRTVLVEPETWNVEDEHMNVLAKRVQLPLILAWSLSIHKSQGQTLQRVKVDLKRVFENGQAYVALSRAVSREGLQVLNFDRLKVTTHPKVNQFYSSLSSADEVRKRSNKGQQQLRFNSKKPGDKSLALK